MALRIRRGNWHYRFEVNGREYTGNTRLEGTERNRNPAQRVEAKALELVQTGKSHELKLETHPFSKAAESFLDWADTEYREHPNSAKRLRTSFVSLTAFFKNTPVSSILRGNVRQYMTWRRKEHQIKEITLRHDLHALSKAFGYWKDLNWARENPVNSDDIPSDRDAVRMYVLSDSEQKLYLQTAVALSQPREIHRPANRRQQAHTETIVTDHIDLMDFAYLMLEQGMRPTEVISLAVADINLAAGYLFVRKGKSRAAKRQLPLSGISREILARRIRNAGAGVWVFPNATNDGTIQIPQAAHNRVLAVSGLSFVLYDLRHTFATRAAEAGMPIATLAAVLGHGDLRSVMKYVHVRQEAIDTAMRVFEAATNSKAVMVVN